MKMAIEEQEMYKENIIDHYKNPHNKHVLLSATHSVRELNPLCGDEITLYLEIKEGLMSDISFIGSGCAISQAASSMLTDFVKGKTVQEIKLVTKEDVLNLLGIPISFARLKCATLCLCALQNVVINASGGNQC